MCTRGTYNNVAVLVKSRGYQILATWGGGRWGLNMFVDELELFEGSISLHLYSSCKQKTVFLACLISLLSKKLSVLMLCVTVSIFTSGSSALKLGRPRCGLSI